jgi:hypothetical protein
LISGFTELFVLNLDALYWFQVWRFLTAIFLHGGVVHLIYNLFALLFFGFILERKIGSRNFLIVFFISGIIGNIIAINFYPSSLGASGAIYGILGCLAIINPMMMVFAFGILMPMFIAAIIWIVGDILGVFGLFNDNTGYIAHLGGVIVGIVVGIILRLVYFKKKEKEGRVIIDERSIGEWENRFLK